MLIPNKLRKLRRTINYTAHFPYNLVNLVQHDNSIVKTTSIKLLGNKYYSGDSWSGMSQCCSLFSLVSEEISLSLGEITGTFWSIGYKQFGWWSGNNYI